MSDEMAISPAVLTAEIGALLLEFGAVQFGKGVEVPRPRAVEVLLRESPKEEQKRRGPIVAICTQYSSGIGYGKTKTQAVNAALSALRTYLLQCRELGAEPLAFADEMSLVQFQSGDPVDLKMVGIDVKAAKSSEAFEFTFKEFKRAA
jgi:hypothetical protein